MSAKRTAIIIGGGPAGLTTALELLERTDIKPIVYEGADNVGGIARTYLHAGNRIDIGGHRFFSKSDRVMDWWSRILPLQGRQDGRGGAVSLGYQNKSRWLDMPADGPNPDLVDDVML
ncbi:MAG: NAD(P)-binding protein, partial [Alphaproteobacteria bacterium]|nr:NAD(P)-binding protein [Alphaproteobacteria bacterium]